ncbi:MAG TPA: VWA domain-containing protein, partial [Candidatus Nitrosopolaris sp.]|nr:VWA domain-containing protein [Candidatus Nitrosopolaris sp.]
MSGVGFANPAGALAFGAVAVLVALYLLDRRRRPIPVGTLFLWRQITPRRIERQRFRTDLLFLLQLLLLLALAIGYLRPYFEGGSVTTSGTSLVLVLDVSASMQTRETDGTRFDLVRRRARALVTRLADGEEVMLVTAGARARVAVPWTADHARMQDRLETLEPLDTPTDLAPAVELALGAAAGRPDATIALFTDLPPAASGLAAEELAQVDYVQVGRTDDNLAIAGLTVDQPPFSTTSEATVTATVRNYSHLARHVALAARVGEQFWTRRDVPLEPRATQQVLLDDPPGAG